MHRQNYQDILSRVRMPTQYAGNEINTIRKDPEQVRLTFALVFPDLYEIGTSHFGLQILYSILNRHEDIAAERFFVPAPDMEALLRSNRIPCLSMESRRPLSSFDIIGVSLLYELNFTNILTLFSVSNIPFYAGEREKTFPLVIGGGPCAFNPEPLADFFDAFVIGDGEDVVVEIADLVMAFKEEGDGRKQTLLKLLSRVHGVYVPSFFTPSNDVRGFQTLTPMFDDYRTVRRAFLPTLTRESFPTAPILPFARPVHDRLRLEIARGCSRGCRFCQAGMIYRPVRERPLQDLLDITRESLEKTGHSDISLLSLSTGDYSGLSNLMTCLHELGRGHCNAISLPSIRAEKLTPDLMEIIRKVRKTGFTIAPEAGSQELRDRINKNLTEESILSTVENAFKLGWKNIKLYFMMGLPFETQSDIEAIVTLSRRLASTYARGKKTVNVSVACFIPKAHTPFQRCAQISLAEAREKLQYLKDHLRHPKLNLKWQNPEMSLIEGVWSRGDRRLSGLLVSAFENGCRLDGWSDQFDFSKWDRAFEKSGIDPWFYTSRPRSEEEPLAWDHIDSGLSPEFLRREFEKAQSLSQTPDCRDGECNNCGVCDFKTIQPDLSPVVKGERSGSEIRIQEAEPLPEEEDFNRFAISFSKLEDARFFGHLELATIVQRAVKRAGLKTSYSKGFNPLMRISFENALPVGMESEEERFFLYFEKKLPPSAIEYLLNHQLPRGLRVTGCRPADGLENDSDGISRYQVRLSEGVWDKETVNLFLEASEWMVQDVSKKGKRRDTDLRRAVEKISFIDLQTLEMVLKKYNERTLRPMEILIHGFGMDETALASVRIRKVKQG